MNMKQRYGKMPEAAKKPDKSPRSFIPEKYKGHWEVCKQADQLQNMNGSKVDQEGVVQTFSSRATCCGTFCAVFVFFLLAFEICSSVAKTSPKSINQVFHPAREEHTALMPQIALVIETERYAQNETEFMKYITPSFQLKAIPSGFQSRRRSSRPDRPNTCNKPNTVYLNNAINIGLGPCGLDNQINDTFVAFCTDSSQEIILQGKFGDPLYSYLDIRVTDCHESCSAAELGVTCAPQGEVHDHFWSNSRNRLKFNVFIKFKDEKWVRPSTTLPTPDDSDWHWWVYGKIYAGLKKTYRMELTHNIATVLYANMITEQSWRRSEPEQWLSFDKFELKEDPVSGDRGDEAYLVVNAKISSTAREVEVTYYNLQDVFSDLGGTYETCLGIGFVIASCIFGWTKAIQWLEEEGPLHDDAWSSYDDSE